MALYKYFGFMLYAVHWDYISQQHCFWKTDAEWKWKFLFLCFVKFWSEIWRDSIVLLTMWYSRLFSISLLYVYKIIIVLPILQVLQIHTLVSSAVFIGCFDTWLSTLEYHPYESHYYYQADVAECINYCQLTNIRESKVSIS